MKKYLFLIIFALISLNIFGQNTFKYEIRANGGLRVGGSTFAEIDSITLQAGKLRIMSGTTLQKIAGHVLYADTANMLTNYIRTNELNSTLSSKVNVSDTAAMLDNYALLSEVGSGASMVYPSGSGIPIVAGGSSWGTTITNNSTEWNKAGVVGNGTAPPYFDGSADGGQILTFYGNNGFWTALQGGAPTANRSYRLPIAALPGAGTTSLINIDEYGNMGFVASTTYATTANPIFTGIQKVSTTDTLSTKAYARSVGGTGGVSLATVQSVVGDTAANYVAKKDSLTRFVTPTQLVSNGTQLLDVAVAKADSIAGPGHYASHYDMTTGLAGKQAYSALLTSFAGLGNSSGVLTNNGSGTLSWAASGGGEMIYPGAGIPVSTGSAWGTSVSAVSATELGYVDGVTSAIQTQLNGKAPLNITLNAQTGTSYTLVLSDAHKIVTMTNNSANTLTIPLNSSVAFPVGTQITVVQNGSGETTIAATSGVILNSAESKKDLRVQYSSCTLIKVATDTWLLIGDIEA